MNYPFKSLLEKGLSRLTLYGLIMIYARKICKMYNGTDVFLLIELKKIYE